MDPNEVCGLGSDMLVLSHSMTGGTHYRMRRWRTTLIGVKLFNMIEQGGMLILGRLSFDCGAH